MPRSNKTNRSCKKARLFKLSNSREPLISIDINSTNPTIIPFNINSKLSSKVEKIKKDLINKINCLSKKELISCFQLLINMVYKDGSHKDEILSPYLQKKAMEWILVNRGKPIINSQEKDQEIRL